MNITMNSAMSVTLPTSGDPAAASSPAAVDGLPLDPALAGAQAAANPLAFLQFLQLDGEWLPTSTTVRFAERPPMREVLGRV